MEIESIKKVGKKYKIEFENKDKMTTYDDVILNNGLLFNKEVNSDLLNKLNIDTNYYDIYYKVINFITRKLRSQKEISNFIDKNNVNDKDKKEIIKKLKSINLINDKNFVKAFINDKIHLNNDGPYKIKRELLSHDIDEDIIDKYINEIDQEILKEKLNKLIKNKIKTAKYSGFILKQKIIYYLINLGYDKYLIEEIYDNLDINKNDLLIKEYNELYKKLSNKYSGKELEKNIKKKLYAKGFSIEEINNMQ